MCGEGQGPKGQLLEGRDLPDGGHVLQDRAGARLQAARGAAAQAGEADSGQGEITENLVLGIA